MWRLSRTRTMREEVFGMTYDVARQLVDDRLGGLREDAAERQRAVRKSRRRRRLWVARSTA